MVTLQIDRYYTKVSDPSFGQVTGTKQQQSNYNRKNITKDNFNAILSLETPWTTGLDRLTWFNYDMNYLIINDGVIENELTYDVRYHVKVDGVTVYDKTFSNLYADPKSFIKITITFYGTAGGRPFYMEQLHKLDHKNTQVVYDPLNRATRRSGVSDSS